ncbi:hypothetical protein DL240_05840 [Lujinxingia litoralis]|uniref:SRPBCC domain-containing protein n=1 Tax=Lujinxingia litoralis TaxID=2211119 RepID=A0A328CB30_9DELT|nr:hypothetical protein [Lujinxingia litoralis]RAL23679.1 hypothetical protein DL240_05840 [Lujinxingia litoralis]
MPTISDDAVQKATGHDWAHWFALLDTLGAQAMSHTTIASHLQTHEGVSGWWAQSITVAYERARGMREHGQTTRGFQVSTQKTAWPDVQAAWSALTSSTGLKIWLADNAPDALQEGQTFALPDGTRVEVRGIRPHQQIRLGWQPLGDLPTQVVIARTATSASGKGTIGFTHESLPDESARQDSRERWAACLKALARQAL